MAKLSVGVYVPGFKATLSLQTDDVESHSIVGDNHQEFQNVLDHLGDQAREALSFRIEKMKEGRIK